MIDYYSAKNRLFSLQNKHEKHEWAWSMLSLFIIVVIMIGAYMVMDLLTTGVTSNGNYNLHLSKSITKEIKNA